MLWAHEDGRDDQTRLIQTDGLIKTPWSIGPNLPFHTTLIQTFTCLFKLTTQPSLTFQSCWSAYCIGHAGSKGLLHFSSDPPPPVIISLPDVNSNTALNPTSPQFCPQHTHAAADSAPFSFFFSSFSYFLSL